MMGSDDYAVFVLDSCRDWMNSLRDRDYEGLAARIDLLAEVGPALGRPTVEVIKASRHINLKELRYGKLRILFAFDPRTQAVLLLGGSKKNRWTEWYEENIPIADDLFDEWLGNLRRNPDWADKPSST
jgi:hypothetical protein